MTTRSLSVVAMMAIALLGAGCSASTSTSSNSQSDNYQPAPSPSQPSQPQPSQPSQPSNNMVDACTAVNKALIKSTLNLTVNDGQSQPSGMQGTTCIFTGARIVPDSGNVQLSPKPDVFYSPAAWEGAESISGYATGSLRGPNDGSLSAAIVKNGKLATVTVYTMNNTVTKEQFVNLLKAIANQF